MNIFLLIAANIPVASDSAAMTRQDSIRRGAEHMIEYAQSDPSGFMHTALQSMLHFGLKLLAAILIYIIGAWLIKRVKNWQKRLFVRRKTEPTLASFIASFTSISMTIILIVIAVGTLGIDTTSLAALLAAGGMAIGMALSGTLQNFAGGIMILAFKPFKAGDFISAQGFSGTVVEVNITSTKLLTVDNRVVILPNGALSNGTIDNYSGQPLRRVDWEISVEYGTDAEQCKKLIRSILNEDKRILQADTNMKKLYKELNIGSFQLSSSNNRMETIPEPFIALKSLNSNDITFVVRAWVRATDYWGVYFDIQERLYSDLPKHGFGFAYPHVDVTLTQQPNA